MLRILQSTKHRINPFLPAPIQFFYILISRNTLLFLGECSHVECNPEKLPAVLQRGIPDVLMPPLVWLWQSSLLIRYTVLRQLIKNCCGRSPVCPSLASHVGGGSCMNYIPGVCWAVLIKWGTPQPSASIIRNNRISAPRLGEGAGVPCASQSIFPAPVWHKHHKQHWPGTQQGCSALGVQQLNTQGLPEENPPPTAQARGASPGNICPGKLISKRRTEGKAECLRINFSPPPWVLLHHTW